MTTVRLRGPENTSKAVWQFGQRLDGIEIEFRAQWLISEEFWIFYVNDVSGDTVIDGLRLIEGNDLFYPFSDPRLPPGRLICYDTSLKHREPGRNAFNEDHILVYIQPVVEELDDPVRLTEIPQ